MTGRAALAAALAAGLGLGAGPGTARADRPIHGSVGVGGALLLTGAGGDRTRLDLAVDLKPRSRYGVLLAWRGWDDAHRGLVMAGLVYEGGAARPRLVLDLHADAGVDLDARRPVAGGGIRTTIAIAGPLGVVLDSGLYVVLGGLGDTRVVLQSSALLAARW